MANILIVEDESGLRESLLEGLTVAFPNSTFAAHGSVEEALVAIGQHPPQLVISDIRLPGKSGIDFLLHAKKRWPSIRFILITAYANVAAHAQASEYGASRLLQKPFPLNELVKAVEEALRDGISAKGEGVSILELVQLANLGKKSLAIQAHRGGASGEIFLVHGDVVHARAGAQEGLGAFMEMIRWKRRDAEVRPLVEAPATTVREPFHLLVREALQILDEDNAQPVKRTPVEQAPVERKPVEETPVEREPTQGSPAQLHSTAGDGAVQASPRPELPESLRPDSFEVQAGLEALTSIDGFLGASLVNSESGKVLSAHGGGSLDVEVAAVCDTEVVRAEREALAALGLQDRIKDILISLGKQYHLLCLIDSKPDLLLYLVLDRAKANLAVARFELAALAANLDFGHRP